MHVKRLKRSIRRFDEKLTKSIQDLPRPLKPLMLFLSWLAQPSVVAPIALTLIVAGIYEKNALFSVGLMILIVSGAGFLLKIILRRRRPLTYVTNGWFNTYSFPSGHTVGGTVTYGGIGYLLVKYAELLPLATGVLVSILILLSLIIVGIGVSRVYLGAHYPSDVVVGWVFGAVAGFICFWLLIGDGWFFE